MEDGEDTQTSTDSVSGIDKAMIGLGVSILAFLPTCAALFFKPAKLSANLSTDDGSNNSGKSFLGPGLFFVIALLIFVFLVNIVSSGESSAPPEKDQERAAFNVGYAAAKGFTKLVDGLVTGLSSGNIWGAVIVAFPIYLFALVLAAAHFLGMKLIAREWRADHSVGACLYILGGWLSVINLITIFILLMFPHLNPIIVSLVILIMIVLALVGTVFQAYNLAAPHVDVPDHHLILVSIGVPIALVCLLLALAMTVV